MNLDFYDDIRNIVKRKQLKSIIHKNVGYSVFDMELCVYMRLHALEFDPPPPSNNFPSTLIQPRSRWENIGHNPFKYIEVY